MSRLFVDISRNHTVSSGAVKSIKLDFWGSHFLSAFSKVSKAIGGLKGASLAGSAARTPGAGAGTDFLAFQGDAGPLADLLPSVPIVEYLQSKEGDSDIEGRVKNPYVGRCNTGNPKRICI